MVAAEPKIQRCILEARHDLRRTLSRYIRQYSGITTPEGRSTLQIGLFDSRTYSIMRLSQHELVVLDGPTDDYFSVTYDLESQRCSVHRYD